MVNGVDVEFIDRQINNINRNISNLESQLESGANRGQFPGSPSPCDRRPTSQDCGAWQLVQRIPGQLNPLKAELEELFLLKEQGIKEQIIQEEPIELVVSISEQVPIVEPIIITTEENNTVRNALIIGGIALLVL